MFLKRKWKILILCTLPHICTWLGFKINPPYCAYEYIIRTWVPCQWVKDEQPKRTFLYRASWKVRFVERMKIFSSFKTFNFFSCSPPLWIFFFTYATAFKISTKSQLFHSTTRHRWIYVLVCTVESVMRPR